MLEKLSESLKGTLSKITQSMFVDKRLIEDLVRDIQRSLLAADVNVKLVFDLTEKIKEKALAEKTPSKEQIIKIVYEELINILGEEQSTIKIEKKTPFKVMLVGLYGSGKTTTIAKLVHYYKKRNYKIATLGLDVYRPAAREQLKQLSDQLNVPCFISEEKDPVKIYEKFEKEFKNYDLLFIDTAGRDSLSEDLISEIKSLNEKIKPDENLLIISADIGQTAQQQAESFHKSCNITGVIVTKMDGTAKAGGALTAAASTGAKIKFLAVGEKPDALESYIPERFVSRLLGMGDLETLLEKAQESISEEDAKDLGKKFLKGDFNLIDLYEQMEAMNKMGSISKLVEMVPGFSQLKLPKETLDVQEDKLKRWRFALDSMTKKELEDPETIERERIDRIAKGSGIPASEVKELLKQYRQSKKLMKMMGGKSPEKLMSKMKGKFPGMN